MAAILSGRDSYESRPDKIAAIMLVVSAYRPRVIEAPGWGINGAKPLPK